jgi:hypothetical protein
MIRLLCPGAAMRGTTLFLMFLIGCDQDSTELKSADVDVLEDTDGQAESGELEDSHAPNPSGDDLNEDVATAPAWLSDADMADTTLPDAAIWNGISVDDSGELLITTQQHDEVYLYRYAPDLTQAASRVRILSELPSGIIADQAQALYDDVLYVAISDQDADDLYIMAVSPTGEVIHPLSVVAQGSAWPTNDMHLLADDSGVHVLWESPGFERHAQDFDHDLQPVGTPHTLTTPVMSAQLGTTIASGREFWTFSGDETNHQLQVSRWSQSWEPLADPQIVVSTASSGMSWNWFPSGVAFHEESRTWFVAYTHMEDGESADDDATIRMAILDDHLALVDMFDVSAPKGYTRPHLALSGDTLFLTYDGDEVYLKAFNVEMD